MGLVLDYGSVFNHHESANVEAVRFPWLHNVHFQVYMGFVCGNRNILNNMQYPCMHIYKTDTYKHINTFEAAKDIVAGQELLVRYGNAKWFENKNIPYADFDYASTMWRPDLHPLPCRQTVAQTTGADDRNVFAVLEETISSGTVLEISSCLQMPIVVVDQFPYLWDFVIMGPTTQMVCAREDTEVIRTNI